MIGFDLFEFFEQAVVFQIANDGRIQHVITIIMKVNLCLKFFVPGEEFICHV